MNTLGVYEYKHILMPPQFLWLLRSQFTHFSASQKAMFCLRLMSSKTVVSWNVREQQSVLTILGSQREGRTSTGRGDNEKKKERNKICPLHKSAQGSPWSPSFVAVTPKISYNHESPKPQLSWSIISTCVGLLIDFSFLKANQCIGGAVFT